MTMTDATPKPDDPAVKKAVFVARKRFAELVYDVQALEGMPFTFPEVQTYIQGVTVGGHRVADEQKLLQQIKAWEKLIGLVESGGFSLSKETACALQAVVARDEALETGVFRDGMVSIGGTAYLPPPPGALDAAFAQTLARAAATPDVRARGIVLALDFARNQFFWDGNKRTGLLMLNGVYLSHGVLPLSIPAARLLEYNTSMIAFYESGDHAAMLRFMLSCHDAMYPGHAGSW